MSENYQGRVLDVTETLAGSELSTAAAAGDTVLNVYDASDFNDEGGSIFLGDSNELVIYLTKNDDDSTITIGQPLGDPLDVDESVMLAPLTAEKEALVQIDENEDAVPARVPHSLRTSLDLGLRGDTEQESVLIRREDDEWVIEDVIGVDAKINFSNVNPGSLPPGIEPDPEIPPSSPSVRVLPGLGSLFMVWERQSVRGGVRYEVYLDTVSPPAKFLVEVTGQMASTSVDADGLELDPDVTYYAALVAFNDVGAAPMGAVASGSPLRGVDDADILALEQALADLEVDLDLTDTAVNNLINVRLPGVDSDLAALDGELNQVQVDLNQAELDIDQAGDDILNLDGRLANVATRMGAAETTLTAAQGELDVLNDQTIPSLSQSLTSASERIDQATSDLDTVEAKFPIKAIDISANAVTSDKVSDGAILNAKLADNAINQAKLQNAIISNQKLVDGAVSSLKIADGAVVNTKIAANAVTANEILSGSIIANKIAVNAVTATAILAGSVVSNKIAANAVTATAILAGSILTNKLAANAVTANEIAANSVIANKIAVGAVTADKVQAKAISASRLAITDQTNYAAGSTFEGDHPWVFNSPGMTVETSGGSTTPKWLKHDSTKGSGAVAAIGPIEVAAGETYYMRMKIKRGPGWNGTNNNSKVRVGEFATAGNGGYNGGNFIDTRAYASELLAAAENTWIDWVWEFSFTQARVVNITLGDDATAGWMGWDEIEIRRKNGGELIVDGAILTRHMTANSINANVILSNSLDANKIVANSITSDQLAANSITAEEIAAGAITANQFAANSITGDKLAVGSITARQLSISNRAEIGPGLFNDFVPTTPPPAGWGLIDGGGGQLRPQVSIDPETPQIPDPWVIFGALPRPDGGRVSFSVEFYEQFANYDLIATIYLVPNSSYIGDRDYYYYQHVISSFGLNSVGPQVVSGEFSFETDYYTHFLIELTVGSPNSGTTRQGGWIIQRMNLFAHSDGKLIVDGTITGEKLIANAITANKIGANQVNANHIVTNTITANLIAANQIYGNHIVTNTIRANHLGVNTIDANVITTNTLHANKIITNTITAFQIAANTITANQLAANTITANEIASNAITANLIAANTITAQHIASNSITADLLKANAIDGKSILGTTIRTSGGGTGYVGLSNSSPYGGNDYVSLGSGQTPGGIVPVSSTSLSTVRILSGFPAFNNPASMGVIDIKSRTTGGARARIELTGDLVINGGIPINRVAMGAAFLGTNGRVTVNHGMGAAPSYIYAQVVGSLGDANKAASVVAISWSSTQIDFGGIKSDGYTFSSVSTGIHWIAFI